MSTSRQIRLPQRGVAPPLDGATGWLDPAPLAPADLHGHVVLYAFWTYTCINWLRALPYVRAWDAKYRDHGLIVVGVHTPEFAFEQHADNVRTAARSHRIEFPVVLDSNYEIWRAFDNHYWPALYLADHRGVIRYSQFGEGRYAETERAIQQLLSESGARRRRGRRRRRRGLRRRGTGRLDRSRVRGDLPGLCPDGGLRLARRTATGPVPSV